MRESFSRREALNRRLLSFYTKARPLLPLRRNSKTRESAID
jgi:hypothetical protein